jgi:hypothetical protein
LDSHRFAQRLDWTNLPSCYVLYFGHDKRNGFVQSLRILFDFWNLTASVHRRLDLHGLVKTWLKSPKINPLASKSEEGIYHQFPSETG